MPYRSDSSDSSDSDNDGESQMIHLSDRMSNLFVVSEFDGDGRDFLPEGSLDSVMTRDNILQELESKDGSGKKNNDIVKFILEHPYAKKIFAIIVSLDCREPRKMMKSLMSGAEKQGLDDRCLPIDDPRSPDTGERHTLRLSSLGKSWTETFIGRFYREQWRFLAPVFTVATEDHKAHQDFKAPCIMSFTKRYDDEENLSKGAFGQVNKCKIHPDHLIDPANPVSESLYVSVGVSCDMMS